MGRFAIQQATEGKLRLQRCEVVSGRDKIHFEQSHTHFQINQFAHHEGVKPYEFDSPLPTGVELLTISQIWLSNLLPYR
jgi:hypothetical protein